MMRIFSKRVLVLFVFGLLTASAGRAAEIVVLKGGKTLELSKPYVVRGTQAVLTLKDGTVMSVGTSEIDRAATQAARARRVPKKGDAEEAGPVSPVEAARAQKNLQKAKVKVDDDNVSHPYVPGPEEGGKESGEGDARVEVVDWEQTAASGSVTVKGNLRNSGSVTADAISMLVMGKDDKGKTLASTAADVSAGTLEAGSVTTLTG